MRNVAINRATRLTTQGLLKQPHSTYGSEVGGVKEVPILYSCDKNTTMNTNNIPPIMDNTLKELVIKEAVNLRVNATPEELKRLDFENFDGTQSDQCIYGQMTGHCESDRANTLIQSCCEKVYRHWEEDKMIVPHPVEYHNRIDKYISPIEQFIMYAEENLSQIDCLPLIQFLKGEITEQQFKDSF